MKRFGAFYRFLFFYALIFFIPFAFSIVAYVQFTGIVEQQEIDANLKLIQKTRDELDAQIIEVEQIVELLNRDHLVMRIGFQTLPLQGQDLYLHWQLSNRLQDLLQTNTFISSLYVYFREIGRVVIPTGAVDEELFYGTHVIYDDLTFSEWQELFFGTSHDRAFLPSEQVQIGTQRFTMLTYIQSLIVDRDEGLRAVAWLFVDEKEIHRVVRSLSDSYQVFIVDENGIVLASSANAKDAPDLSTMSFSGDTGYQRQIDEGVETIVSYAASKARQWKIVTTVPTSVVISEARYVRRMLFVVTVVMSILGVAIALILARRSAKPIVELVRAVEKYRAPKPVRKGIYNEYELIKSDFLSLVSDKESLQEELHRQLPMLQSAFFERLYMGEFTDENEILQIASHLELELKGAKYCTILIKLCFPNTVDHRKRLSQLFSARSLIKRSLATPPQGAPVYMHDRADDEIAALVCLSEEDLAMYQEYIADLLKPVDEALRNSEQMDVVIAGGHPRDKLIDLWEGFRECLEALDSVRSRRDTAVHWHAEREGDRQSYYYPTELEIRLMNNAKAGNAKQVQNLLGTIYTENAKHRHLTPDMNRLLINDLQCTLMKILYQVDAADDDEGKRLLVEADKLRHIHNFDGAYELLRSTFDSISDLSNRNKKSHKTELVEEIRTYLDNQFPDPGLNRHRVASSFNMSEGYFSSFFKEQTGTSFTEYLEQLRLRRAAGMLMVNGQKISSIAQLVGYSSEKAFSRAFKRSFGINPSKYRDTTKAGADATKL